MTMLDEKIVQEIRNTVLERGRLTKADIIETWDLTEEAYAELQGLIGDGELYDFPSAEGDGGGSCPVLS